jgi:hypothetical protein
MNQWDGVLSAHRTAGHPCKERILTARHKTEKAASFEAALMDFGSVSPCLTS